MDPIELRLRAVQIAAMFAGDFDNIGDVIVDARALVRFIENRESQSVSQAAQEVMDHAFEFRNRQVGQQKEIKTDLIKEAVQRTIDFSTGWISTDPLFVSLDVRDRENLREANEKIDTGMRTSSGMKSGTAAAGKRETTQFDPTSTAGIRCCPGPRMSSAVNSTEGPTPSTHSGGRH
jgi:hypothetical protein